MEKLKDFFSNNDVRIGEGKDFTVKPPVYYSSLNNAFYNYFLTFKDKKEGLHFILDIRMWKRESLAFNFTGSNSHIVFAILGFHRFIELLLKDILRRVNPFLAVKFLEKEEEVFKYLNNQIKADDIKTIEYSDTIKRFKQAFKHYDKTSEIYNQHLKDYEFLISQYNLETLNVLSEWRNRIMHNGTTLPNLFAFDYLISQRIIPLVNDIINAERNILENHLPLYFETKTGIKVIDEILKIKFHFEDFINPTPETARELAIKVLHLGHLKELGRTAYNQHLGKRGNISFDDPYKNPNGRVERFAETETKHEHFYSLNNCISCGTNTLIVYRMDFNSPYHPQKFISWFNCFNCDYSLKDNVGDPSYFGLCTSPLFAQT